MCLQYALTLSTYFRWLGQCFDSRTPKRLDTACKPCSSFIIQPTNAPRAVLLEETDADSVESIMSESAPDNGWWSTLDNPNDVWQHPLVDETEQELYPATKVTCTIDKSTNRVESMDVTEACSADYEEGESNSARGLYEGGDMWLEGLDQGPDDGLLDVFASCGPAPFDRPSHIQVFHVTDEADDAWSYLSSDEFLSSDFMNDLGNEEQKTCDMPSKIALVSPTQSTSRPTQLCIHEMDQLRVRLAASMQASQKSRRDCWHRSFDQEQQTQHEHAAIASSSVSLLQHFRPQVSRVLAKIEQSTASVQNHCLKQNVVAAAAVAPGSTTNRLSSPCPGSSDHGPFL